MQLPAPLSHALQGTRIVSLALNLPGPAALLRCQQMGAHCTKVEPPAPPGMHSADLMSTYSPAAYAQLHAGLEVVQADLKAPEGQQHLHQLLAHADVVLTAFRPGALRKLGLDWDTLHPRHPQLCMVAIVGSTDPRHIDEPGHDLTYQAQAGLTDDGHLPPSLFADMGGALLASEAVLQCLLLRARQGQGQLQHIGLAQSAHWLALPRRWGMTTAQGAVGGAHAGYNLYRCQDGWVALAALEPHFAHRLCAAMGCPEPSDSALSLHTPALRQQVSDFIAGCNGTALEAMAAQSDIPLHVIFDPYK